MMINIQKLIEEANESGYQGDKRWIDEEIDVVTKGLLEFVSKI